MGHGRRGRSNGRSGRGAVSGWAAGSRIGHAKPDPGVGPDAAPLAVLLLDRLGKIDPRGDEGPGRLVAMVLAGLERHPLAGEILGRTRPPAPTRIRSPHGHLERIQTRLPAA